MTYRALAVVLLLAGCSGGAISLKPRPDFVPVFVLGDRSGNPDVAMEWVRPKNIGRIIYPAKLGHPRRYYFQTGTYEAIIYSCNFNCENYIFPHGTMPIEFVVPNIKRGFLNCEIVDGQGPRLSVSNSAMQLTGCAGG